MGKVIGFSPAESCRLAHSFQEQGIVRDGGLPSWGC
jgi:hypothetical protein